MQNIPGIAIEKATDQIQVVKISTANRGDQHALFADLFAEHANMVENELALAPVSHQEKMLDSAPQMEHQEKTVNAAGTKAPVKEEKESVVPDENARMTQEDLDGVKEDLQAYGMTEEEIAKIEEQVKSEDGMTWGQFVNVVAQKIAAQRNNDMSDDQKGKLMGFFSKFGFTEKESEKLVKNLENGDFDKVMKALQAKIDAMPQNKQMLFDKQEVEAFATTLGFSKEFTAKVKELFSGNTLPKDMKEAFTLIRQEMAAMDKKDQELIKAVGKAFAKAMGDESKASTAARQIAEAIDLKPRVAEEEIKQNAKEDLAQAVKTRSDALPEANVRKTSEEALASKAEIKAEAKTDDKIDGKPDDLADADNAESDDNWNNLFSKMSSDDKAQQDQTQAKNSKATVEALSKTGTTEAEAKVKTNAWEKVSAPKVMKQVDNAIFKNLQNGTKQLTLQLTPENLGKLAIVLTVQGKEVGATIKAESPEAARLISDNLDIIKNSLESQGLKVEKLEVQTGLANNQNFNDWHGENEHNLSREREAMIAMRNHMKQMREGSENGLAQDLQQFREQAINADNGLHVIA